MPLSLYAETLLTPGLGTPFMWRFDSPKQQVSRDLLGLLDPESPVYGAWDQAIDRFERTVFSLELNKPTLISGPTRR